MANSIEITLCGDILPTRSLAQMSSNNQQVFETIRNSDFSLGNFEIPVTDRGSPIEKLLNIRAPSAIASTLDRIGINAACLANNHAMDYGWMGVEDTQRALEACAIKTVGTGVSLDAASQPLFANVSGVRVGILAFSCLTPTGTAAAPDRPGLSPLHIITGYEVDPWYQMEEPGDPACVTITTKVRPDDLQRARSSVATARQQCDVLIVTLHWGFGSTERLAEYQRPLAEELIESGADIVHGHHPHAIQAFGLHQGKPIIFSANALIGQQVFLDASEQVKALWRAMSLDGYITKLLWHNGSIERIEILPIMLDANRLPTFAEAEDFNRIARRLDDLSAPFGAQISQSEGRITVAPSPPYPTR
jgi:poly-gamma-glutamate capsule biosynthesis protein CapA/YwtB (metallophosphatase superfamily)